MEERPDPFEQKLIRAYRQHGCRIKPTARALGLERNMVRRRLRQLGLAEGGEAAAVVAAAPGARTEAVLEDGAVEPGTQTKFVEQGSQATSEFCSDREIRSEQDAIEYGRFDPAVWRVKKIECTAWQVGMKLRRFDPQGKLLVEEPLKKQLWRVKLFLERILPKPFHDALRSIAAELKGHKVSFPRLCYRKPRDPHMLELDLFDAHFGKLAWGLETGLSNYDLRIAERVYRNAFDDLMARTAGLNFDEILLPIGQDFFNVDNPANTTVNGTPQDTDGRLAKIHEAGTKSVIWAVERALPVAPVRLKWVPGNHDRWTSYYMAKIVEAHFRGCPHVEVDCAPTLRKYHRYGVSLIGLTHGDEEKPERLPTLMATERPLDFAETRDHYWHCGHFHRPREINFVSTESYDGTTVQFLHALSGVDAFHYRKGFVGTRRAAEAFVWSKAEGLTGRFYANVRE